MNFSPVPGLTKAENQFMHWLYVNSPKLYQVGINAAKRAINDASMNGLGVDWGGIFTSITNTVKEAAPALLQLKQQKDLLKLQIERAKKSQPPITAEDYAAYATPAVSASVEAQGKTALPVNVQPVILGMPASKLMSYVAFGVAGFMVYKLVLENQRNKRR